MMKMMDSTESSIRCISWSAIVIGSLVAVGLGFLLNLFSIATGLSLVKSTAGSPAVLAVGGFIGLMIGCVCILFVSGFVAGFLARCFHVEYSGGYRGIIYGFAAWSLALVLSALLTSAFTRYTGGYIDSVTRPTSQVISRLSTDDTTAGKMQTARTARNLSVTAYLVFALFFAGAVSSCFGGYFGMSCDEYCRRQPNKRKKYFISQ